MPLSGVGIIPKERRICLHPVPGKVPNGFGSMEDRPVPCSSDKWVAKIPVDESHLNPGTGEIETLRSWRQGTFCANGHFPGCRIRGVHRGPCD